MKDGQPIIFVHSLWRSGSTYFFEVFRRISERYFAYQEPIHETMLGGAADRELLRAMSPDATTWMRHPPLSKGYFEEAFQTHEHWHTKISKEMIYDRYFQREKDEELEAFLLALDAGNSLQTVVQECRTAGRIGAIRQAMGGVHLYVRRNPWDQWWSYKVSDYFGAATQIICHAAHAPPSVRAFVELHGLEPFHGGSIEAELEYYRLRPLSPDLSYQCFFLLWALGWREAHESADLVIDIDELSRNQSYRQHVLHLLNELEIGGLSFDDCQIYRASYGQGDRRFFEENERQAIALLALDNSPASFFDELEAARRSLIAQSRTGGAKKELLESLKRAREAVFRLEVEGRQNAQFLIEKNDRDRDFAVRDLNDEHGKTIDRLIVGHSKKIEQISIAFEVKTNSLSTALNVERQKTQQGAAAIAKLEEEYSQKLKDKEHEFFEASEQYNADYQALIRTGDQERFERDQRIAELDANKAQLESDISELLDRSFKKEALLSNQIAISASKLIRLEEAHQNLSRTAHQESLAYREEAARFGKEMQEMEASVAGWASDYKEMEERLSTELQNRTAQLRQLDEWLQNLRYREALARVQIANMRASLGWRLTAFMRRFSAGKDAASSWPVEDSVEGVLVSGRAIIDSHLDAVFLGNDGFKGLAGVIGLEEIMALPTEAFVQAAYRAVLGRPGDEVGVRGYVVGLMTGLGRSAVFRDLANSAEGRRYASRADLLELDGLALLSELYMRNLGRVPDEAGAEHYLSQLDQHGDKMRLIEAIESSAEARGFRAKERNVAFGIRLIVERENKAARSWKRFFRSRSAVQERNILVEYMCATVGRVTMAVTDLERLQSQGASGGGASQMPVKAPRARRPVHTKLMQQLMIKVREDVAARKAGDVGDQSSIKAVDYRGFDEVALEVERFVTEKSKG